MRDKKQKSKQTFNRQAATYDQDVSGCHARSLYPVLLKKLSQIPYRSALDLGCGTGEMLRLLSERDGGATLSGIDLSEKMLEIADAKLQGRARLVLGDSEHLPFPDGSFDVVYCNDSFHHYPAPEVVLAEVRRVLTETGTFVICDSWHSGIGRVFMNIYFQFSRQGDVKIYSEREITALFSKYFQNVHWEKIDEHSCMAWGEKNSSHE